MKYIDTEKLKELFDKKYKEFREKGYREDATYYYFADGLDVAKQLVESLQHEQPKVDFEKEIDFFLYGTYTPERFPNTMQVRDEHTGLKVNDWKCRVNKPEYKVEFARHFYELGKLSNKK